MGVARIFSGGTLFQKNFQKSINKFSINIQKILKIIFNKYSKNSKKYSTNFEKISKNFLKKNSKNGLF